MVGHGAAADAIDKDGRTAMHFACVYGHIAAAEVLLEANAGVMAVPDLYGVTPHDLVANPGAVSPADALRVFNIKQRSHKQIHRVIHPELHSTMGNLTGWRFGTGGWDTKRLKGYETDMQCDGIDQYYVGEINGSLLFDKYIARNMPVLIRGALDHWVGVGSLYKVNNLKSFLGAKEFTVR